MYGGEQEGESITFKKKNAVETPKRERKRLSLTSRSLLPIWGKKIKKRTGKKRKILLWVLLGEYAKETTGR